MILGCISDTRSGHVMYFFNASEIIPGHGMMCGEAEINTLREYLQSTWELTAAHICVGHGEDETAGDPGFPHFLGEKYERLHQENIRYMYKQIKDR